MGAALAAWPSVGRSEPMTVDCTNPNFHFTVWEVRVNLNGDLQYHRGTRATTPKGMTVVDSSPTCDRVSSMFIIDDAANALEFGWSEWNSANGASPICTPPDSTSQPRVLLYGAVNYYDFCVPDGSPRPPISDGLHTFSMNNLDMDGDVDVYLDGDLYASAVSAPYNTGLSVASTERFELDESQWGNFNAMQYQSWSGWHDWNNRACLFDDTDWWDATQSDTVVGHVVIKNLVTYYRCDNRPWTP